MDVVTSHRERKQQREVDFVKVNITALQELLQDKFRGNQTAFSYILGIDRTHFNKILRNNGSGAGIKFCEAIMKYCTDNAMDYQKFILFENNKNKKGRKGGNKNVS